MTKKDYEAFAAIINKERRRNISGTSGEATVVSFANKIADYCAEMNPRFKRNLFFKACGLDGEQ